MYDKGITKLSYEKYHIRYKLTNKQKNILQALGSNEKEYQAYANEVKSYWIIRLLINGIDV